MQDEMAQGGAGPEGGAGDGTLVIPAVSLLKGRVVVVNKGRYEPLTDVDDKPIGLHDFVDMFLRDYETVCVLDIDGIERRKPQLPIIQMISPIKNVWWDPGVRDLEDMMDTFTAGANRVVVGTKTIWNLHELLECQAFSADFVLSLDWSGHIICRDAQVSQTDPLEFLERMHEEGVRRVLFSQYGRVSAKSRVDLDLVRDMVARTRRLYLGGSGFSLSTADEIGRSDLGVRGVVVGVMDLIRESIVQETEDFDEGSVLVDEL